MLGEDFHYKTGVSILHLISKPALNVSDLINCMQLSLKIQIVNIFSYPKKLAASQHTLLRNKKIK